MLSLCQVCKLVGAKCCEAHFQSPKKRYLSTNFNHQLKRSGINFNHRNILEISTVIPRNCRNHFEVSWFLIISFRSIVQLGRCMRTDEQENVSSLFFGSIPLQWQQLTCKHKCVFSKILCTFQKNSASPNFSCFLPISRKLRPKVWFT